MKLNFIEAKKLLVEHALGDNEDYEKITTWQELREVADLELSHACERERLLSGVVSASRRAIEDHEFDQESASEATIPARFELLTIKQQEQAYSQWTDAAPGDGYLYQIHGGADCQEHDGIIIRHQIP